MKTYILVGEEAIHKFHNEYWEDLQCCILNDFNGDIIAWNKEVENVSDLLDMLQGWDNFIELSKKDLLEIKNNTKIEIV